MKYAKIVDNKVVQLQPYPEAGFEEVEDTVICGMVKNQDDTFSVPEKTTEEQAEEATQQKWEDFSKWRSTAKVTITNGNQYGVNDDQRMAIREEMEIMEDDETASWVEDWGTQETTKSDFAEALKAYKVAKDAKLTELGLL